MTSGRVVLVGVFALSFALYLRSMAGGPILDDYQHLSGSSFGGGSLLGALTGPFLHDYYRPLTSLSYLLDLKLWGSNPALWHQTSILIHAVTSVLVVGLAWALFQRKSVAIWSGVLFAIQPAQVGAAAWIGGRTDELSALLIVAFLWSLVSHYRSGKAGTLALATVMFFLACAAKEQNVAFLFAAPLLERFYGHPSKRRSITTGLSIAAAGLAFGALWIRFYPNPQALGAPGLEEIGRRVALSFLHYVGLILLPNPRALISMDLIPYGWFWILPALALVAAVPWLVRRTYQADGRAGALLVTALIAYLPISNLITIPSAQVAPYRLANVGAVLAIVLGWAFAKAFESGRLVPKGLVTANLALSLAASVWAVDTWRSESNFYDAALRFDGHNRLLVRGAAAAFMHQPNGSLRSQAVTEDYLDWLYGSNEWESYAERGVRPPLTGTLKTNLALSVGGIEDPSVFVSQLLNFRAVAMALRHDDSEALASYLSGFDMCPANGYPVGIADLLIRRDPQKALTYYQLAASREPNFHCLWAAGEILRGAGRYREAAGYLSRAVQADPTAGDGWVSLGLADLGLHDFRHAKACLQGASGLTVRNMGALAALQSAVSAN